MLNSIPLCKYAKVCLPLYLLMEIWVISHFWLLNIKPLFLALAGEASYSCSSPTFGAERW